jgi:hypothetical protein
MNDTKLIFHRISYLQYPLMIIALFFCYKPILFDLDSIWTDLNKGLVFLGLGMSFSTLQDTTKTQNKISRRIYENPTYSRWFFIVLVVQIILFTTIGLFGLLISENGSLKELSFGFIALGIGVIGMLKSAIEMAENIWKNLAVSTEQSQS